MQSHQGPVLALELDIGDFQLPVQFHAGTHRSMELDILHRPSGHHPPVPVGSQHCQALEDRQRVDAAGDDAAEVPLLRKFLVSVETLRIPLHGERVQILRGHLVRAQIDNVPDCQILGIDGRFAWIDLLCCCNAHAPSVGHGRDELRFVTAAPYDGFLD